MLFHEGLSQTLGDGALHLSFHQHRVELGATVLHRSVLQEPYFAGVAVQLHGHDMRPKGKGVDGQAVGGWEVGSWVKVGNHLFESDRLLRVALVECPPIGELHVGGGALQQV